MAKRRKFEQSITANEDKASNASSERESDMEKQQLHAVNSNATNVKDHVHQISNGVEDEKSSAPRRSNRLKGLKEPVMDHVDLVEEDEKEPESEIQTEVNGRNLEERVDSPVKAADDLKSKALKCQDEGTCLEIRYKSLYLDSQKKIEALMEENYDLVRKLEFARGKIAAYEVMKNVVVGAQKEVILVSAANLSSAPSPPAGDPKPRKYTSDDGSIHPKPKKKKKEKKHGEVL